MTNPPQSAGLRERLDKLLVMKELAENRQQARGLILSGAVLVDGRKVDKVGSLVLKSAAITLKASALPFHGHRYVSRGGLKLDAALEAFRVDPRDCVAVDVGASTGGFTDCLLQHGAKRVMAVDVGYGQLAWRLRQDPRVKVLERTHIRNVDRAQVEGLVDLITIDVSFISLTKVLPYTVGFLKPKGAIIALVKPQFEVGRKGIGKGGIVRDPDKRKEAVSRIQEFAKEQGLTCLGVFESPVHGREGNVESFLLLKLPADPD